MGVRGSPYDQKMRIDKEIILGMFFLYFVIGIVPEKVFEKKGAKPSFSPP